MQAYQEEYIANLKEIAALADRRKPEALAFSAYELRRRQNEGLARQKVKRNVELLRGGLVPALDHLFEAKEEEVRELEDFAAKLAGGVDAGLFRRIHQALLSLARLKRDRTAAIRELYWLGMGYYWLCNNLAGLDLELIEKYVSRMRLCFTEAAAYLKYFDEIEDTETRGYILRSRANMALGPFKSQGEKIRLVRETLRIMQDERYQEVEPNLPWERYLYMTHQQMASSIAHDKSKVMSPEDTASIMESVYIVYQQRIQEAEARHERPTLRWAFPCCTIEYYCGLYDFGRLLAKIEKLLDAADPEDHSPEGVYGIVSLPAFYCQYLMQEPERIPGRAAYVDGLYQRALDYVDSFPAEEQENLALYLWQLSCTYIETGGGMSYGAFLEEIMLRFAPELYLHSRMVAAARRAEIYEDIMAMPQGFDTYVGERGTLLSGGQKQRISIARIFLKDPPVLILDEATSALDSVTEAKIQRAFDELARGRTTLIIAHRLSTVRNASRILVVRDGVITEEGTHEDLLAKDGDYAQLYRTQNLHG